MPKNSIPLWVEFFIVLLPIVIVKDLQMGALLLQNCLTCEINCKFVWNVTCVTVYISKWRLKYLPVETQSYAIPCTTF
ncbi:hypothetical protein [Nostoc sp. CHAB 5715]|uniref:hypothetical protein n=1 Tax=Nostoc sp. CHAB 5715 TaxID=2780400 RepID=UPI001E52BA7B|nr:hypothetical protein [Nostoc sp. CHAB 5715]